MNRGYEIIFFDESSFNKRSKKLKKCDYQEFLLYKGKNLYLKNENNNTLIISKNFSNVFIYEIFEVNLNQNKFLNYFRNLINNLQKIKEIIMRINFFKYVEDKEINILFSINNFPDFFNFSE